MNRRVFLDSSFWIALRAPDESSYGRAQELLRSLAKERNSLVVTLLVLAETHAYFSKTPNRARQILDDFENNPLLIVEPVTPEDQSEATSLLRQHSDKMYSFCDAVSFVMMRRLGIRRVASLDRHFRQFGEFEVLN